MGDARPVLVIIRGPGRGRSHALEPNLPVVLGKSDTACMHLPYSGISREHARVTFVPGSGLQVEDLGSTNGTFIDARRVEASGDVAEAGARLVLGSETEVVLRVYRPSELEQLDAALSAAQSLAALSSREREVAYAVANGLTSARIAKQLFISPRTVTTHLDRIYARLDLPSRAALTRLVIEARGVMPDQD